MTSSWSFILQQQLCQLRCLMTILDNYMFRPLLAIFRLSLRELKILLYKVRARDGDRHVQRDKYLVTFCRDLRFVLVYIGQSGLAWRKSAGNPNRHHSKYFWHFIPWPQYMNGCRIYRVRCWDRCTFCTAYLMPECNENLRACFVLQGN